VTGEGEADPLLALAERLHDAATAAGRTIGTAESCTGGLIAATITRVPGSSAYFLGSVVAYSDDVKRALLDVPADVLEAHGAVSAQTALAMATGARRRLGVGTAVSVTGIAGPDGGSDDKPVGLTYVGVADGTGSDVRRFAWGGDREANVRDSAAAALELLLERLAE
jgi:PncC family amidohydrolase